MELVSRVKGILLTPKAEWAAIDTESATVGSLYTSYIIPLAAIPPVCALVGLLLIGWPISLGLESAVVGYVLALVSVYVLSLIIDALAPSFGGQKNQLQALKVAAYSSTASWVVGIFFLIPALGVLAILGIYSLYLLFVGLPILMKAPEDKAVVYTIVVIVCAVVLYVVIGTITSRIFVYPGLGALRP